MVQLPVKSGHRCLEQQPAGDDDRQLSVVQDIHREIDRVRAHELRRLQIRILLDLRSTVERHLLQPYVL